MDFVVISLEPWDTNNAGNCKNITDELSKRNRVLYVNPFLDRITWLKNKKRRTGNAKGALTKVASNVWLLTTDVVIESINWLPSSGLFNKFNYANNRVIARAIKKAISHLSFEDIILFNDNDIFRGFYLKELLKPFLYVYYRRDNLLAVDYWHKHGKHTEPQLIRKSDLVVTNSLYYAKMASRYNHKTSYIGQGCDFAYFDTKTTKKPSEALFEHAEKPIIGYVGALTDLRLDIDLLEHIAVSKPNWDIVLIGPEDKVFANSSIHTIGNIHFLGRKDLPELSGCISAFDVAINPQKVNEVTIGNYPRKIDEYLALGKPVVATETDAMDIFREHVYLANTAEDYVTLIEKALSEDSDSKRNERIAFAHTHSWENSVAALYDKIATLST